MICVLENKDSSQNSWHYYMEMCSLFCGGCNKISNLTADEILDMYNEWLSCLVDDVDYMKILEKFKDSKAILLSTPMTAQSLNIKKHQFQFHENRKT